MTTFTFPSGVFDHAYMFWANEKSACDKGKDLKVGKRLTSWVDLDGAGGIRRTPDALFPKKFLEG
jgi:hypothetical protein